jgi:adenine-specific DNA-methyltransferase
MDSKHVWGPENPHPLSRMKTELVWEGKFDEYGNRRPVKIPETPLPLQRIETIDEPRDRARALAASQGDLFDQDAFTRSSHRDDFRNMLIWGDNKLALSALLEQFRGQVDLIYIDPPFDVGADFTMKIPVGEEEASIAKEQSVLEAVAFRDMWGREGNAYPHFMFERLTLARDLLKETGNILVHCDWRMNTVLRALLDDLFHGQFRNEIIWHYYNKFQGNVGQFASDHDTILYYSKAASFAFAPVREKREQKARQLKRVWDKEKGAIVNAKDEHGHVIYIETDEKTVDDVWRLPMLQPADRTENTGYATQKPEAVLCRAIKACCPENGTVLDFFCGAGTACAVAEKSGRKWIGADLGRFAIHTTRKRLIGVQRELHAKDEPYRSFDVYNLGRYERQWWQMDRLKGSDEEHRALVLKFYRATHLAKSPHPALHATKSGAYVHVDEIDGLLSFDELREVAKAAANVAGIEDATVSGHTPTGKRVKLICLAWEFEMDLRLRAQDLEAQLGLEIQLTYIPREIMEANRNEIQFFDAGAVDAEPVKTQHEGKTVVDVKLTGFYPALTEVPDKEMEELRERAVRSPFDFIDFWAVDFEHADDKPFEHHWQDFRTRKDRSLKVTSTCQWQYDTPGKKSICVKVIDVFGVDTTTVVQVEV